MDVDAERVVQRLKAMMWGDVGKLYFWIRSGDLAKREFSRVWMILQC